MLQRYLVAYLFILPVLLLYVVFVLRPTLQTFWLAFYKWNGIAPRPRMGRVRQFQRLLGDPIFWQALQHSLIWTAVVVTFNLTVGLAAAARSGGQHPGRLLFRLGYFLPVVQASIVTAMIWRWIYAPTGVLNTALETLVWDFSAGMARRFHRRPPGAGHRLELDDLRAERRHPPGRDAEHRPDALRRGPRRRRRYGRMFLDITIPSLRNTITIVILLALVDAFKVFDIIWATTQGGPIRATEVLSTYLFKEGSSRTSTATARHRGGAGAHHPGQLHPQPDHSGARR